MIRGMFIFACVAAASVAGAQPVQQVTPVAGMVISKSVRLKPGVYAMASASLDKPAIVIRGSNITVDFTGVRLEGTPSGSAPDAGNGVAILIDSGANVTVRGVRARGYKVAIMARGVRGLQLEQNDLSHNWKPRLFSLVEHESLVDWLSYHRNENREWLRFGAGIYLENVTGGHIRSNTVEQGMNGLLMTSSDSLRIVDNNFSFNSGLGIGMYRSSHNVVTGNRIDYNVRGYSHGFYRRGQDSAGILMYEQSSNNVVAFNSVTHGGDGLFLWAGQSTMDTGKGGANDNLYFGNDFSYAPTNGMEATFSRNDFIANIIRGSDHGLWGGYSYESRVIANCFANNRIAIAIEHGQQNVISHNRFDGDTTAIRLWANPIEPSDWGYPKHRDTKSRDYRIEQNTFAGNGAVFRIENTTPVDSTGNQRAATQGTCNVPAGAVPADVLARIAPYRTERPVPAHSQLPRSAIIVDEWGPYDWRSPRLWPVDSTRAVPLRMRVVGPSGNWRVIARSGVAAVSAAEGKVGDTILVTPVREGHTDWSLQLEYRGDATTAPDGSVRARGVPVRFSYSRFEPKMQWNVRFFAWNDSTDFRSKPEAFNQLLRNAPLLERSEPRLDYMWYRPAINGLPQSKFALEATSEVTLPDGKYTIRTISDDAVRVWVDDRLVIDHWTPHESMPAYTEITGGRHRIRVQYAQVEGWTELRLDVLRGSERHSTGSAGPH